MDMQAMLEIQQATQAARRATKDNSISTRVKQGKFQIVRVTYRAGGTSNVEARTGWLTKDEATQVLRDCCI